MIKNKMSVPEFRKQKRAASNLSNDLRAVINTFRPHLMSGCICEYRFHEKRLWRFDLAWPALKVSVECDGMVWQAGGGRHNTDADREKINTASSLGWTVLRFSGNQIKSDPMGCLKLIEDVLKMKSEVKK